MPLPVVSHWKHSVFSLSTHVCICGAWSYTNSLWTQYPRNRLWQFFAKFTTRVQLGTKMSWLNFQVKRSAVEIMTLETKCGQNHLYKNAPFWWWYTGKWFAVKFYLAFESVTDNFDLLKVPIWPFENTARSYFRVAEPLEASSRLTQTVMEANHRERSECTQHGLFLHAAWRRAGNKPCSIMGLALDDDDDRHSTVWGHLWGDELVPSNFVLMTASTRPPISCTECPEKESAWRNADDGLQVQVQRDGL